MSVYDEGFGGNIGMQYYVNRETRKGKWLTPEEAALERRWIDTEDKELDRFGMGLSGRDPKDEKEAAFWDKYQKMRGQEFSMRNQNLRKRADAMTPATLFLTPDGEVAVPNDEIPQFLKDSEAQGFKPRQMRAFMSKGFTGADGKKYDAPRFFAAAEDDPSLNALLRYQQQYSKGYLPAEMMHVLGYDTEESFNEQNTKAQKRAEEAEWKMKQLGPMDSSSMYGNKVGYGGVSLTEKNKNAGNAKKTLNFFNDNLNPVSDLVDKYGQALELELGSDEGLKELKRREANGEPLLGWTERARLGIPSDIYGMDAESLHDFMRERVLNRRKSEYEEGTRGTTFGADVLRATTDSARMGAEHALVNTLLPGAGSVGKEVLRGAIGTGIEMGLHGEANRRKLMADQVRYNPETGNLTMTGEGAGALEATLKGYGAAALEYVGEMYTTDLLWKPIGKGLKAGANKFAPNVSAKFTDFVANRMGGSALARAYTELAANPTAEAIRRISKRTGFDLSLAGLINESIGEELPTNVLTGLFNLEGTNDRTAGEIWADTAGAFVDTLKAAPAMAISVAMSGAGTNMAVRSAQGMYNLATDRKTMVEALEALGHSRDELKSKSKQELNDMFFGDLRERGYSYGSLEEEEKAIDELDEPALDAWLTQHNILPPNDNGSGIPIEQKREAAKNAIRAMGGNLFANKALYAIQRAAVRQIMRGWNYGNAMERLDAEILKGSNLDADERDTIRKIVTLHAMSGSANYKGNLAGAMVDGLANGLKAKLSDEGKTLLAEFENKYHDSSLAFPGTQDADGVQFEASTFQHPIRQSDWNNNDKGGYVDFSTGIALRPLVDADGTTLGYKVDADGMKVVTDAGLNEVDKELSRLGLSGAIGLPQGVATTFNTLEEARNFADKLSAWQNTEKKRLLEKAQAAEMLYRRTRGDDTRGGLVLLRRTSDAPEQIRDEIVDALIASGATEADLYPRFTSRNIKGFTSVRDGRAYVFLDNVESPYDLMQTIQHEGLHQGLLDTFRGDRAKVVAALSAMMQDPDLPDWLRREVQAINGNVRAFEELLAQIAESVNAGPSLFSQFSRAFRKAMARVDEVQMNDGDVQRLVFDAFKAQRMDASQMPNANMPSSGSYNTMMAKQPQTVTAAPVVGTSTTVSADTQSASPTMTVTSGAVQQTTPAAQPASNDTEKTTQPAPKQDVQAQQSAPTQTAQPASTAEPTTATGKRASNVVKGNEDLFDDEEGETTPEAPKPVESVEKTESGRYIINTEDGKQGEEQKPVEEKPTETAEPNEPQAEATPTEEKPAEEKPVEQKPEAQEAKQEKTTRKSKDEVSRLFGDPLGAVFRDWSKANGVTHSNNAPKGVQFPSSTQVNGKTKLYYTAKSEGETGEQYIRENVAVSIDGDTAHFKVTRNAAKGSGDMEKSTNYFSIPLNAELFSHPMNIGSSYNNLIGRGFSDSYPLGRAFDDALRGVMKQVREVNIQPRETRVAQKPVEPKQEQPKQETSKPAVQAGGAKRSTGSVKTDAAIDDLEKLFREQGMLRETTGMLRETGAAPDKEFKRKVKDAVDNIVESEIENGTTRFRKFISRIFGRVNSIPKFWNLSKPYFHSQWTLAKYEHDEIDSVTYDEAQEIFKAAENGTIDDNNNTQNKEQDDGRSVNSSQNVSPDNGVGSGPSKSGEVQSQRTDGADGSVGNRVSRGDNADLRGPESHEDVVPGKSASSDEDSVGRTGGRDSASGDGGRGSGGQTTSVPEVGSPTGERVVSESSTESGDSASDERGERGPAKSPQKVEGGKDSLLKAKNYRIPADGGQIGKLKNERARVQANLEALTILKQIAEENRPAKATEQEKLALYSGWGGLSSLFNEDNKDWTGEREALRELLTPREYDMAQRSVQYAHYTPIPVVMGMYAALERLGVKGAGTRMFEAGAGVGHFIGSRPDGLRSAPYIGIEIDPVSARIAKALYPKADIEQVGFQDFVLPANSQDVVIGNPPFSDIKLTDTTFPESRGMSMHNHFIAKQINALRPGGIGVFIVSRYFMDGQNTLTREYIAKQADLIGAIRLPNGVFGRIANTDVVTDIVVFRKRMPGEAKPARNSEAGMWVDTALEYEYDPDGKKEKGKSRLATPVNKYFANSQHVAGRMTVVKDSQYNRPTIQVQNWQVDSREADFNEKVEREIIRPLLEQLPENIYKPERNPSPQKRKQEDEAKALEDGKKVADGINHPALMEGGYYLGEDGSLYVLSKDEWGARKGVKVQNYDEKAEKAAYEKRVKEQQALDPKFKGKKFDRFESVPDSNAKFTPKEQAFIKDYVHLRNVRYDLIALERSATATDEQIEAKRKELNEAYEACKKSLTAIEKPQGEFSLNTARVLDLIGSDPASAQVRGLEEFKRERDVNDEGVEVGRYKFKNVKKAAIFNRRVYTPAVSEEQHFDNVKDAYIAGINLTGKVNLSWISKVTGLDEEAIEKDLLESGLAFYDPSAGEWKHSAAYLSGDVKTKLAEAKQALKDGDKRMEANVKALEAVQPEYLPSNKITVTFGSPILEQEDVSSFISETLGIDVNSVSYSPVTGLWDISLEEPYGNAELKKNFPTAGLSYHKILNAAINNKSVTVKNSETEQVDQAATELANQTVKNIRNLWESWWQSDSDIATGIADRFNERYNRYAEAKYDGSVLTFEGLAENLTPYKHQRDAVMRTILTGNILYNHVVGSGKTNTAILSIMEMRRMGLVKKPCIIVPNSLTQQWRSEILSAYPGANVLAPLSEEFEASERKRLLARIQNGDWDVVVIPHSQLSKISLQPSVMQQFYEAEAAELRAALSNMKKGARGRSRIEKRVQALEERIKRNMESLSKDNTGMFFDTLGIDGIFVDEAHEFKNVPYASSRQVSGMGNAQGSAKALDLLTKVQWMRSAMPEAPIAFLTGTPVSNSLVEFYLNMRYMAPDLLRDAGIHNLDSFLEQFVDVTREYEITPAGTYKEKERVRNLKNIGALMMMVRSYMDVVDSDDLKVSMKAVGKEIDIPELESGAPINEVAKRSPEQRAYFGIPLNRYQTADGNCTAVFEGDTIIGRAEAIAKGGVDPSEDNMLKVVGDSMKASLDFRLVDPNAPDFAGSKVNLCVSNVLDTHHKFGSEKGTQIIFCDRGIPNSGKGEVKKELQKLKNDLEDTNLQYQKAINKGKTDEEIAVDVDENGESLIDKRERLSAAIIEREGELNSSFSVYDDIKQKLVKQGIPAEQIAFIHDYPKDHQKKRLFEKVNTGEVRVLIGSTAKMGTGVNVQQRICAVHHLDVPWRPADLTQRNGRAIRQGNLLRKSNPNFKIKVMYYATERTSDAFRWQTVESKAKGIDMVYKAGLTMNVVEDISEDAVSSEEMKAQSVGSKIHPRSAELNKKMREMNEQRSTFYANRNATVETIKTATTGIQQLERGLDRAKVVRDTVRPLERPKGNFYHDIELVDKFNGKVTTFEPQQSFNAREKAEGNKFETIAKKLIMGQMLRHRGLIFSRDPNSHISQFLNGYLTEADAKAGRNAVLYSVASLSPNTSDGILFSAITRELNLATERVERMEEAIATQRKTLANAEARLAEMPEKFEVPAEFEKIEQEAKDIEFVKARNAMTGQEASYALSVKYGKEGKPVPQYDWADPTDYGEEGVPTPVVDAGGNAGLLREARINNHKRKKLNPAQEWFSKLPKAEKAVFYGELNSALSTLTDEDWARSTIVVVNTYEHGFVCDVFGDDDFAILQMWNIEKKHGKLMAIQEEVRNAINSGGEGLNTRNGLFWSKRTDYYGNYNGVTDGDAEGVYDEVDHLVRKEAWVLTSSRTLSSSIKGDSEEISDRSEVDENAGLLREAAPLDEHLQARRDAMPKMGLEAARANVQAALHREAGESRKAWGKRKAKAIGAFVSRKLVDARRPLIDAVREITGGVKLSDDVDIATAMQLAPGRIMVEHQKIDADYIKPVIEILVANNVAVEQLDTYLTAMYAPERNKMIFERTDTKKHPGSLSGSGITNEEAAKRLDELRDMLSAEQFYAMERAAEMVWKMNWETLERLSDAGVLAREQVQEWRKLSPHYVPLRDDLEKMGLQDGELTSMVGQPFMRAVGRFSESNTSQLGWSILQAKQSVLWAEQNLVNNVALNFCRTYESKDDYVVSAVPARALKVFHERKGFRMEDAIPLNENVDAEREAIARFKAGGFTIVPDPKQAGVFWVDSTELDRVLRVKSDVDKVRTAQRHNVIAKVNGKRVYILFNRKDGTRGNRMGRAISRANIAHPDNWFWNTYAKMTRVKTALTTTLSPTFAVRNLMRDLVNTTGIMMVEGKGAILKKVYKNYASSLKEVYNWRKKGKFSETDLGKYCQEAIDNGILTGTWATASHENTMIDSVLEPILAAKQRAKFGKEVGATIGTAYRSTKNFLELFSSVPEVGIRLAVYAAMRDSGVSMNDATVYAREITVDFNKKGELTPVANILYMFSNANIQAFNRWTQAVYKDGQFNTKGALLGATTFFLIGFMNKMLVATIAEMGEDDDDEEWKNIPNYAWERGLPIMVGDHYVDVPLSGLPTALTYLGSRMYDVFFDPTTSVADAFIDTAKGPLLDSGNFVNGSGSIYQYLSPTLFDPIVQISRNESWTGAPLHAEDYGNDTTPRAYLGRKQTTAWAKGLAKALNAVSGGNDVEAGYIDVYPETIAMIGQFFTGQLGTEVAGVGSLLSGDIQTKNVPIVKGVFRKIPDNTYRYYERAKEFDVAYRHWKDYTQDRRLDKAQELIERKPFLKNLGRLYEIDKRIRKVTREINKMAARGLDTTYLNTNREKLRDLFIKTYEEGYKAK